MKSQEEKKVPFMQQLKEMEPGQELTYPIEKIMSIRPTVYTYGRSCGKKFSCIAAGERKQVIITRIC